MNLRHFEKRILTHNLLIWLGGLAALLRCPESLAAVQYVNEGFSDGTPLDGTRFTLPCAVDAGSPFPMVRCPYMDFYSAPNCPAGSSGIAVPTTSFKITCVCPGREDTSDPLISGNFFCFTVIATGSNIQFTASEGLLEAADNRAITLVQTAEMASKKNPGQFMRTFALKARYFVDSKDLGVCFTANGTSTPRCVSFHLMLPPDIVSVAPMDYGDGPVQYNSSLTAYPWQTLRFTLQAHDHNTDNAVSINVLSLTSSGARTMPVRWEGPAACVDPYPSPDGTCAGGVWQRVFAYTPQADDATDQTVTFNATDDAGRAMAAAAGAVFPAWLDAILSGYAAAAQWRAAAGWGAALTVPVRVVPFADAARAPAFVDGLRVDILNGTARETLAGTPPAGAALPTAYVGCPAPKLGIFAYFGPAVPVTVRPTGRLPRGMAVSAATRTHVAQLVAGGAAGALQFLDVTWTPSRGQEGRRLPVCFVALAATNASALPTPCDAPFGAAPGCQRRCFYVNVARCQYCATVGDTVKSIADSLGTSWLQIWSANAAPFLPAEGPLETAPHRRWDAESSPDAIAPGDLLRVGPVYLVRPGDTLEGLAARFATSPPAVYSANPDLDPAAVAGGGLQLEQPLCIVPQICG